MSSCVPYAAMSRTLAIQRARAEALHVRVRVPLGANRPSHGRLFSAFEIDFVGATSDFLNVRGVAY
jgi:hypothetical protein